MNWILIASMAIQFTCLYLVIRVLFVHRYRIRILDDESRTSRERLDRLKRLPSFDHMMIRYPFKFSWKEYLEP